MSNLILVGRPEVTICSPALKRCAEGDLESALKEAMKSMSQQTHQIANMLDAAAREQTGSSVNEHFSRGQNAVQQAASVVRQQAEGEVPATPHICNLSWKGAVDLTACRLILNGQVHYSYRTGIQCDAPCRSKMATGLSPGLANFASAVVLVHVHSQWKVYSPLQRSCE